MDIQRIWIPKNDEWGMAEIFNSSIDACFALIDVLKKVGLPIHRAISYEETKISVYFVDKEGELFKEDNEEEIRGKVFCAKNFLWHLKDPDVCEELEKCGFIVSSLHQ